MCLAPLLTQSVAPIAVLPTSLLSSPLVALLVLSCLPSSVRGSADTHKYEAAERVQLYVNKIGPYANPLETYPYYNLPYCHPVDGHETDQLKTGASIGETLEGHSLRSSGFHIFFGKDSPEEDLCTMKLTKTDLETFSTAVRQQYFYQMYLDDLPVWGMVGEQRGDTGGEGGEVGEVDEFIFTKR